MGSKRGCLVSPGLSTRSIHSANRWCRRGRLIGTGAYYNHHSKDISIQIEGTITEDNRFWPKVETEVAMDATGGDWKAITAASYRGVPACFTVSFEGPNVMLYFDLQMFRPFVGRERFGRVTLKSGE